MAKGPSGSASHFGSCLIIPLCASGSTSEKAKAAALPELVSSQMPVRSKTVTARPASVSKAPTQMPMMPPPMMATSSSPRSRGEGARKAPEGWRPSSVTEFPCTSALPLIRLPPSSPRQRPPTGRRKLSKRRQFRPHGQRILDDLFHRLAALARQRLARHANAVIGIDRQHFSKLDVLDQIRRDIEIEQRS